MEKEFVYCNSCLGIVAVNPSEEFKCANPKCTIPYRFRRFESEEQARAKYRSVASWMPKFYFRTKLSTTAQPSSAWCVAWHNESIEPFVPTSISDLIEPEAISLMQGGLWRDIGCATSIIDPQGNRFEPKVKDQNKPIIPFGCTHFCGTIRSSAASCPSGQELCEVFDRGVLERIKSGQEPLNLVAKHVKLFHGHEVVLYAYRCWAGLIDYACPIRIGGQLVAVMFAGQRRLCLRNPHEQDEALLDEVLAAAAVRLNMSKEKLFELSHAADVRAMTAEEIEADLARVGQCMFSVLEIAEERYRQRREENENDFCLELTHHLDTEDRTRFGVKNADHVLKRLKEFFGLGQAYFLINDIIEVDSYRIAAKATPGPLSEAEKSLFITLNKKQLAIRDRISVFDLTAGQAYADEVAQLSACLGADSFKTVWVGTCPLEGATSAFWLFIDPSSDAGLDGPHELTKLPSNFLTRFCIQVRNTLNRALATEIVMRSIGHELGAGIQSLFSNNSEVASGKKSAQAAAEFAKMNLSHLYRYSFLLESIRHRFLRRDRDLYSFKVYDLGQVIHEICDAIRSDPLLADRGVVLKAPELRGQAILHIDKDMMGLAFYNLIMNAMKYSFSKHYVEIKGRERRRGNESTYEVVVANYGVGILPGEMETIFLPDYRGRLASDRNRTGSGLGLAIADKIIRNHDGAIFQKASPVIAFMNRAVSTQLT